MAGGAGISKATAPPAPRTEALMNRSVNILLPVLLLVGGCGFTEQGDLAREVISAKGAQAMDEGLRNAEFFICRAASVGAVMRRYGTTGEKARAWRILCSTDKELQLIESPDETTYLRSEDPEG